jgi:UPF0755 protein
MRGKITDDGNSRTFEPWHDGQASTRFFSRRVTLPNPNEPPEPPELPPHRRRPGLSAMSGLLSFLLLVSVCGLFGAIWGAQRLHQPGPLTADKILYIAPGTDFPDIIATLQSEDVIASPVLFNVAVTAGGHRSKIKAGEYLFKQQASMHDVIDILVNGRQVLHSVTIPEGLTSEQVVERLRNNDVLAGDIHEMPKEGSLLPETYKVPRGMARAELIRRMQQDQRKLIEQIWAHRASDLVLRSPYELVTLASIVEKETGKPDERPHVAGVFLNRLQKRMRLQSDPTIVYGIVGGKGTLGRPIQHAEVERPTPYNTYAIDGLPPGPIANPGRASLEAVANPSHTGDLYFVADGTGGHVFAVTLEQHAHNVQRWREIQKEAKEKAGTDVDRFVPQPPVGRPNQRSDLESPSIYGALPRSLEPVGGAIPAPSLGLADAATAMGTVALVLPIPLATAAPKPQQSAQRVAAVTIPDSTFTLSPGLDQLGISVRGVPDERAAAALLDGVADPADSADPQSNIGVGAAAPPDQTEQGKWAVGAADLTSIPANATTAPPQQIGKGAHPAAFDASEGTPLDPLRDKTYDLNYPKTVPSTISLQ